MEQTESPSISDPPRCSSLLARLFNVFAAPGEVFDEVKDARPSIGNWLAPVLIVALVTIGSFALVFSQPTIKQQIIEIQGKVLDQQVEAGQMKPEQARQAKEFMENMPPWMLQIGGVLQGLVGGFFSLFWWALVVWAIGGKLLKGGFSFTKSLEVSGLALMVLALSVVVTSLLVVILGNIHARLAPSFFLAELNPMNLFYLWSTALLALRVAKLGRISFGKAAAWMFGFWVVMRLALIGAGLGSMVL